MGSTERSGRRSRDKARLFTLSPYCEIPWGRHTWPRSKCPIMGGRFAHLVLAQGMAKGVTSGGLFVSSTPAVACSGRHVASFPPLPWGTPPVPGRAAGQQTPGCQGGSLRPHFAGSCCQSEGRYPLFGAGTPVASVGWACSGWPLAPPSTFSQGTPACRLGAGHEHKELLLFELVGGV